MAFLTAYREGGFIYSAATVVFLANIAAMLAVPTLAIDTACLLSLPLSGENAVGNETRRQTLMGLEKRVDIKPQ